MATTAIWDVTDHLDRVDSLTSKDTKMVPNAHPIGDHKVVFFLYAIINSGTTVVK